MSYSYSKGVCNFKKPIKVGSKTLATREWIEVSNGKITVDLAPLPGLHLETLEESLQDFKNATYKTPSALFVKEVFELFTGIQEVDIISNGLLYIDLSKSAEELSSSLNSGSTYKIKIGRNDLSLESKWVEKLLQKLPKDVSIRLDGNMSFSADELNRYLESIDLSKIQYIEEPLRNLDEWANVTRSEELNFALDENISLRRELDFASYIVAKPTWNISLKETLKELAVENQEVIISSAFEPPNNLKILKMIASESEQVAGLDTLTFFDLDSLIVQN